MLTFSGLKRSIKITDSFDCTSSNVIYHITCTLLLWCLDIKKQQLGRTCNTGQRCQLQWLAGQLGINECTAQFQRRDDQMNANENDEVEKLINTLICLHHSIVNMWMYLEFLMPVIKLLILKYWPFYRQVTPQLSVNVNHTFGSGENLEHGAFLQSRQQGREVLQQCRRQFDL